MRSSDLHLFVDLGGANVQRAAEQAWEGQYVVDLVRVVRTAGADNGSASFFSQSRVDLRGWVSAGKDDWIFGHGLDHILGQDARSGYADKDVCALDDVGQRTGDLLRVSDLRHFSLDRVEAVAALIDGALAVAEDSVRNACGEQQLGDCDGRCASAADNDMNVLDVFADNLQRIDQASQGDDGSAVLVIVEDRDVADFFELLLDVEALWGLDVLEVDAAEGWLHEFYRLNDLVRILGVQADRESVYARKGFKQNRFAFHNRQTGASADVAQAQYGGAVGDDSNHVALCGVFINIFIVFLNLQAGLCYAWGVSQREVVCAFQRNFAFNTKFTMSFSVQLKGSFINIHGKILLAVKTDVLV